MGILLLRSSAEDLYLFCFVNLSRRCIEQTLPTQRYFLRAKAFQPLALQAPSTMEILFYEK